MKKKGFTLVELLAVIAILAILVIIALPNVMGMFRNAKKNSFATEVKEVFKTAQQQWMMDSMTNTNAITYGRGTTDCTSTPDTNKVKNHLDLSGRTELKYRITIAKSGAVTGIAATDGTYNYKKSGTSIKIEEISVNDVKEVGTGEPAYDLGCDKDFTY